MPKVNQSAEIGPRRYAIGSRIGFLAIGSVMLMYLLYLIIFSQKGIFGDRPAYIRWVLAATIFLITVANFLELRYFPFWITVDGRLRSLELKYAIGATLLINLTDIASYNTVLIKSKSGSYYGVYLNLESGKKILLSDLNLEDYSPVEEFLSASKVPKGAEEIYSAFNYFFSQ